MLTGTMVDNGGLILNNDDNGGGGFLFSGDALMSPQWEIGLHSPE